MIRTDTQRDGRDPAKREEDGLQAEERLPVKPALPASPSCTFSLQNSEKINVCCLSHTGCGTPSQQPQTSMSLSLSVVSKDETTTRYLEQTKSPEFITYLSGEVTLVRVALIEQSRLLTSLQFLEAFALDGVGCRGRRGLGRVGRVAVLAVEAGFPSLTEVEEG